MPEELQQSGSPQTRSSCWPLASYVGLNGGQGQGGRRSSFAALKMMPVCRSGVAEGRDAIKKMAEENPGDFVKVVASTMPKLVGFDSDPLTALSDAELREILEFLDKEIAKSKEPTATIGLIEQQGSARLTSSGRISSVDTSGRRFYLLLAPRSIAGSAAALASTSTASGPAEASALSSPCRRR